MGGRRRVTADNDIESISHKYDAAQDLLHHLYFPTKADFENGALLMPPMIRSSVPKQLRGLLSKVPEPIVNRKL